MREMENSLFTADVTGREVEEAGETLKAAAAMPKFSHVVSAIGIEICALHVRAQA